MTTPLFARKGYCPTSPIYWRCKPMHQYIIRMHGTPRLACNSSKKTQMDWLFSCPPIKRSKLCRGNREFSNECNKWDTKATTLSPFQGTMIHELLIWDYQTKNISSGRMIESDNGLEHTSFPYPLLLFYVYKLLSTYWLLDEPCWLHLNYPIRYTSSRNYNIF